MPGNPAKDQAKQRRDGANTRAAQADAVVADATAVAVVHAPMAPKSNPLGRATMAMVTAATARTATPALEDSVEFIVDSGTTDHTLGEHEHMVDKRPATRRIRLADIRTVMAQHVGTMAMYTSTDTPLDLVDILCFRFHPLLFMA